MEIIQCIERHKRCNPNKGMKNIPRGKHLAFFHLRIFCLDSKKRDRSRSRSRDRDRERRRRSRSKSRDRRRRRSRSRDRHDEKKSSSISKPSRPKRYDC